jgi:hypothetical protein
MVKAHSHLKLLSTSISDIYKVLEHINMLFIGIQHQPYTVISTLLGSDFCIMGHMWSQNDVIRYVMVEADGHLKLLPASILDIYKVFEHIDMLFIGMQ